MFRPDSSFVGMLLNVLNTRILFVTALLLFTSVATAQEVHVHEDGTRHVHAEDGGHEHEGLHFAHPIFTESISPDTKFRLDLGGAWEQEGSETELEFEGEYAFHRAFSIEFGAPVSFLNPDEGSSTSGLGNISVALKFANYAFEEEGVLLGYGIEFGLPTGSPSDGIGSDHIWDLEPFLNAGYKSSALELVSWARFGIPVNQREGEEVETEFAYDVSLLYHHSPRVQALLELNGHTVASGEEAGAGFASISPGVKLAPVARVPLFIGIGGSFPLSDQELDAAFKLSGFYHF